MIIDASAAAVLLLPDEGEPAPAFDAAVATGPLHVPQHWFLEIASLIRNAERRQRIDEAGCNRALIRAAGFRVRPDSETGSRAFTTTVDLAVQFGLTVYDASYLELDRRLRLPLATNDHVLIDAARRCSVPVIGSHE